jgi:hypothetical protein
MQSGREQLAERPVGRRRRRGDDEEVAGTALLDRSVDHEVVTRVTEHRHGAAGHAHILLDRSQRRADQTRAAHRLVDGGDAMRREGVDGRGIRPRDVGDDDGRHASSPVTCG